MEAPTLDRRLVAILAADVEGYSRVMAQDEEAALAILSGHRAEADELIAAFRGRIANTAGDSVLAEFASVVDAVRCALAIQGRLAARNWEVPEDRRMAFRIGINVGDVMVKDGDIFGDGVNIAARLQALAEAGGICVSRGVRDQIRHLGTFRFEDLGEQVVKNLARPVRAFRVAVDDVATPEVMEAGIAPSLSDRPLAVAETALDMTFWESAREGGSVQDFLAYLERFPDGQFAALARERIASLGEPNREASGARDETAVELLFWESVKDSENPAMFEAYLDKYPDGNFALLARAKLVELGAA